MKLFFIISSCVVISNQIVSQNNMAFVVSDSITFTELVNFEPDQKAKQAINQILKYTGLTPNITIVSANVSTAVSFVKNGKRYIGYNPEFIKKINNKTNNDWATVSIIAHELGHHLCGHTIQNNKLNPGDELSADKFSGFILQKMGATLHDAQLALQSVNTSMDTIKHPPIAIRLIAVTNGWYEAQQQSIANFKESKLATITTTLLLKCMFNDDENIYFVDDKNRILWYDNTGKAIVIGAKETSNNKQYQWYYVYNGIKYAVDNKGNMWTETLYGAMFKVGIVKTIVD